LTINIFTAILFLPERSSKRKDNQPQTAGNEGSNPSLSTIDFIGILGFGTA
jgi:hypothetical protein